MRKRSEITKKKSTAAERTEPIQYKDPTASVHCEVCDEDSLVGTCTERANGVLECPACGAPIKGEATPSKPAAKAEEPEPEEDIPFPEDKTIATHPVESPRTISRKLVFETKNEIAKQDAMLKNYVSGKPAVPHEPPPVSYCSECGTEWAIVDGKLWPNCQCPAKGTVTSVDSPTKAAHYRPQSGTARAAILGRTMHVTRGKATFGFPGVQFGSFAIGPYSVSAELSPGANILEVARGLRDDMRKIADEAFDEEMKWYEEKVIRLGKLG
jgi:hypothetical protein